MGEQKKDERERGLRAGGVREQEEREGSALLRMQNNNKQSTTKI